MDRGGFDPRPEILRYLNRALDLLFAMARYRVGARGPGGAFPGPMKPFPFCLPAG